MLLVSELRGSRGGAAVWATANTSTALGPQVGHSFTISFFPKKIFCEPVISKLTNDHFFLFLCTHNLQIHFLWDQNQVWARKSQTWLPGEAVLPEQLSEAHLAGAGLRAAAVSIPLSSLPTLVLFQVALSVAGGTWRARWNGSSLLKGEVFPEFGPRNDKVKTTLSYIIRIFGQKAEETLKTPSHTPRFCFINKPVLTYKLKCK